MSLSKPKKPKKTAEEVAAERRTTGLLDEEIEKQEELLKALARNRLGSKSLLSGAARTRQEAAGGRPSAGVGASAGSLLAGGGRPSVGGGSNRGGITANSTLRQK